MKYGPHELEKLKKDIEDDRVYIENTSVLAEDHHRKREMRTVYSHLQLALQNLITLQKGMGYGR